MPVIKQPNTILCFLMILTFVGCATTVKAYRSTEEKNLKIESKWIANSFPNVYVSYLYVYEVDAHCQANYLGYVRLDKPLIEVGLPTRKLLQLTVEFVTTERFSGSSTRISYSYLLRTKPADAYTADIQNQEKIYKFTLLERPGKNGTKRVVEQKQLGSCVPK